MREGGTYVAPTMLRMPVLGRLSRSALHPVVSVPSIASPAVGIGGSHSTAPHGARFSGPGLPPCRGVRARPTSLLPGARQERGAHSQSVRYGSGDRTSTRL